MDIYSRLSQKLAMEQSPLLPQIWRLICSEEEAAIVDSLPGCVEELADRHALSREAMASILENLYHRGAVFDYEKSGQTFYRMPRHIVQFHDATLLWPEAPPELLELWKTFMDSDYRELLKLVTAVKLPSFMRVIPIQETLEATSQVLPSEHVYAIVQQARNLAVTTCVCRKSLQNCQAPREVCLQLDRGADYAIKRGTGRKIDAAEALAILEHARAAGLVHVTENRGGSVNAICNCCRCCCEMLRYVSDERTRGVLAPSRYRAVVDAGECTACALCVDICPVGALTVDASAAVDPSRCLGCGLCATTCPTGAIRLTEVREQAFIPGH